MQEIKIEGDVLRRVMGALDRSILFNALEPHHLKKVAQKSTLLKVGPEETIVAQGEPSDALYVILSGAARVIIQSEGEPVEVGRLSAPESIGEMGILMDTPRSATVIATERTTLARIDEELFRLLYERIPGFGLATSRALARRLVETSRKIPLPTHGDNEEPPSAEVMRLLPIDFIQRHRVLPISTEGKTLKLGVVDDPTPALLTRARNLLSGMDLATVAISADYFNRTLERFGGAGDLGRKPGASSAALPAQRRSPKLDPLLKRMVAEGASDLHLSAGWRPRWRIDGDLMEISDAQRLGPVEVLDLLTPTMTEDQQKAFEADNDLDFAYVIPNVARFRVNVFRDNRGVGSVLRQIPAKILTMEQLGLPPILRRLCEYPKGLVLVTGPTGSGKSTTLAAMIDHINKTQPRHIITLEDPIEFVHESQKCLVNQREVGSHTHSFARALKSALREDPDIVLVGEMRDLETVSLALETANTGHLVFGTLHTATAITTVDRIVDLFPHEQQSQIRTAMSETLRGVVAQTLCKRVGGGRIAALEILVANAAVGNLIRTGKTSQLINIMQTGKSLGNSLLNDELAMYVRQGIVDYSDAIGRTTDKPDLAKRLGRPVPGD